MAKYIDAEKLIHDLEERIFAYSEGYAEGDDNRKDAIETLLKDVKYQYSLQQEQSKIEEDWVEKRKQECGCRRLSADGSYQCERYEGVLGPCDGRCSWVVDYPKLKGLKEMKRPELDIVTEYDEQFNSDPAFGKLVNRNAGIAVARHFYERGQRKAAEMYDEIEYNRQRAEEEMSDKTLNEKAVDYANGLAKDGISHELYKMTFVAGAKWMAEQGAQLIERIKVNDMGQPYILPEYIFLTGLKVKEGEKVIVQIRKKEESK